MKLTAREKAMLILLAVISGLLAIYYLLWEPQMLEIQSLEEEKAAYEVQLSQNQKFISSFGDESQTEYLELKGKIEEKTKKFFPVISEEKIIMLLDGLFADTGIQVKAMNFSDNQVTSLQPKTASEAEEISTLRELVIQYYETLNQMLGSGEDEKQPEPKEDQGTDREIALESMSVTFQYSASFNQLMDFIRSVEELNRAIVFDELIISQALTEDDQPGEGQILTGTISMTFYAIPKITDQDADYADWPIDRQYGTDNPFLPFQQAFP